MLLPASNICSHGLTLHHLSECRTGQARRTSWDRNSRAEWVGISASTDVLHAESGLVGAESLPRAAAWHRLLSARWLGSITRSVRHLEDATAWLRRRTRLWDLECR